MLVIVMMVKNEATAIEKNLSCFFSGGIRHFLILDTGSTDDTVALVSSFFETHAVEGSLFQETFIDFSASRNRALLLAKTHFPDASFFLMPDAEWTLHGISDLLQFCDVERDSSTPLYLVKMCSSTLTFYVPRLFRTAAEIQFNGLVHEAPVQLAEVKTPDAIYFEMMATSQGIEKSKQRWVQDAEVLLHAHQQNPDDPRQVFYLAQTYECLEEHEKAYLFYQRREKLQGWDEENFMTCYRLGCLAVHLHQTQKSLPAAVAIDYFLKAFALRPHRIEPLVQLADFYWPHNIPACFLYTQYAYEIPFPAQDTLFIEREHYHYTRYELMSRCAWHMGKYELGEQATLQALKVYPNMPHLQHNLALYQGYFSKNDQRS